MKILPVEAEYFHTDGERHDELMSPFVILQRRLNCGKGIYENQKLSGIVLPLRDPVTRPRVPFTRTGPEMGRHITLTPSLQWVNGQTASATTTGTPARLSNGSFVQTYNGRTAIRWSRNGFERRDCANCNKQHVYEIQAIVAHGTFDIPTSTELHR